MSVPPDTKDWTWVLDRVCPDCAYDSSAPSRDELGTVAGSLGERWTRVLLAVPEPRTRPDPAVWSPLEYACHVRDVLELAVYRSELMLREDDPLFENWDQDATAVDDDYAGQEPALVLEQVRAAAGAYSELLRSVEAAAWGRPGRRSNGSAFTVESFTRYLLHDAVHHLTDVSGQRWTA